MPATLNKNDVLAAMSGRYAEFYGQFTALKPHGDQMRGACPLHGGANLNFAVFADGGWQCFSKCGADAHGDVFDFLEKKDGLRFLDALAEVAAFAGVTASTGPRSASSPRRKPTAPKPPPSPPTVFLDIGEAEERHAWLMQSKTMRDWLLEKRGLTTETLTRFQLGLTRDKGGFHRVCFPVFDAQGRMINIREHLFAYKEGLDRTNKTLPCKGGLSSGLFPVAVLQDAENVLLVEGEADAALACQMGFAAVTGTLGAGTWKPEWSEALRGRSVTILYDGDAPGKDGAASAAVALSGIAASVCVASYPEGVKDFTEWVVSGAATAGDVQQVMARAVPHSFPAIETNGRHLRDKSADALAALVKGNVPPALFVRGGELARVQINEKQRATIKGLTPAMLRGHMARCADFISTSEKRGAVPVAPPKDVVEDVLALPEWPGIPPLTGIVTAPVFSADGQLDTRPGYHPAARLFYHETCAVPIPDTTPTENNVFRARALLLNDLLGDFPFAEDASRAHAAALLLLPFVRPMIDGPTPLHLIDAPSAGTGKSLLARACTLPFTASGAPVKAPPTEEAEWSKTLTSVFSDGDSHLLFDNVRNLNSPSFFAALTSTLYKDRMLATNRTAEFENRLVWLATCNNIQGNDEMTRRSVWIRLDAGVERPEARDGFQHADLAEWAASHRGELIGAALTLVRKWVQDGQPPYAGAERPLGSFEAWARVMGGILESVGISGFLENREEQRSRVDTETAAWHGFVEAWRDRHGSAVTAAADLFPLATEWMPEKLGDGADRSQKSKFGRLLVRHVDKVFAGQKIVSAGKATSGENKNMAQYRLDPTSQSKTGRLGRLGRLEPLPRVVVSEEDNNIHIGRTVAEVSQVSQVSPDDVLGADEYEVIV